MMATILKQIKIVPTLAVTALLYLYTMPTNIYADALSDSIKEISQAQDDKTFVNAVVNFSIPAGIMGLVALSSYAGYLMVTSQGNPDKLNEAREIITNAFLGFALIGLSVAILLLIQDVLQLPLT